IARSSPEAPAYLFTASTHDVDSPTLSQQVHELRPQRNGQFGRNCSALPSRLAFSSLAALILGMVSGSGQGNTSCQRPVSYTTGHCSIVLHRSSGSRRGNDRETIDTHR